MRKTFVLTTAIRHLKDNVDRQYRRPRSTFIDATLLSKVDDACVKFMPWACRLILVSLFVMITGCDKKETTQTVTPEPTPPAAPEVRDVKVEASIEPTINPLNQLIEQQLLQALDSGRKLQDATARLLTIPDFPNMAEAQSAWDEAAKDIEALSLLNHIAAETESSGYLFQRTLRNLNSWPIEPGYLDTYGEHPYSGLVFEVGMPLSAEMLRNQHGLTSANDVTLGIYAIEFILFGENNNRGPLLFLPLTNLTDKDKAGGYKEVSELPRNRRRQLLQLQTELLVSDLSTLQQEWTQKKIDINPQNYRQAALALINTQRAEIDTLLDPNSAAFLQERIWRSTQLAMRLTGQISGLKQGIGVLDVPQKADLMTAAHTASDRLQHIVESALPTQPGVTASASSLQMWPTIRDDLGKLAALLAHENINAK
jgi:Imelysin